MATYSCIERANLDENIKQTTERFDRFGVIFNILFVKE